MAITRSRISTLERTGTCTWEGESFEFAFLPGKFTVDLGDQATKLGEAGDSDGVATIVCDLVPWWDVLEDDGSRIPVTVENLRGFPIAFLISIMATITENVRPPADRL